MPRLRPIFLLSALACAPAWANGHYDELDRFLSERGLLEPAVPRAAANAGEAPNRNAPAAVPPSASSPASDPAGKPADRMSQLVVAAMGALGVPYRRGGNTFDSGYDCSGFVRAIYEQNLGITLPRVAAQQAAATHVIEREELQPGDLVFFNTLRRPFSHVGIYVGDHKFIHSPRPGAVVRIEDMRVHYWNRRFEGARRVADTRPATLPGQTTTASSFERPNY